MYQAWLEVRNMFGRKELWSRVGRQEIVLGNQFQFGNADWYNGVVFDGGRIDWTARCWSLTLLTLKLSSLDGDVNQVSSFRTPTTTTSSSAPTSRCTRASASRSTPTGCTSTVTGERAARVR